MDQRYPIQKFNFTNYAYLTKEFESAAIMERYWLSSSGFFILLDYEAPLFIDQNNNDTIDHICFTGKKELPYDIHSNEFVFNYRIGAGVNARETHLNVINRMLGKPKGIPDERIARYPIWNTWVRYGRQINQQTIADLAEEIIVHGFNYSLIDIDDFWEDCYGKFSYVCFLIKLILNLIRLIKCQSVDFLWTQGFDDRFKFQRIHCRHVGEHFHQQELRTLL